MSGFGGRPLTFITPAMLDAVQGTQGIIVSRYSRCGSYVTYQAASLADPEVVAEVAVGRAVVAADVEDVESYRRAFGDTAAWQLQRAVCEAATAELDEQWD